ncbi:ABC transporter ATP-binding protein [soil metagenome]
MADRLVTPTGNGTRISLAGVRRVFDGGLVAVDGVELTIAAGEFLAILGPSGSGKSTLLRMIAGLDQPSAGTVELMPTNGESPESPANPTARRFPLAYVFQDAHLLPWRNVLRNVALPLELAGVPKADRLAAAREAIARVGLADVARLYPAQLSGGMRMRVSLARALVTQPKLLLLDEPFAALDEITRHELDEQLRDLWRETGMTVVFVTHSIMEATFLAERAIVVSKRPARIVLDHPIALPSERNSSLRGEPAFAREMSILLSALQRNF